MNVSDEQLRAYIDTFLSTLEAGAKDLLPQDTRAKLLHLLRHAILRPMKIQFTSQIFREGRMFVAHSPELEVSSCATTEAKAEKNLLEAVRLFLEEAEKKGSLDQILKEAGFVRRKQTLVGPRPLTSRRVTVPLSTLHA